MTISEWSAQRNDALAAGRSIFHGEPNVTELAEALQPLVKAACDNALGANRAALLASGAANGALDRLRSIALDEWAERIALLRDSSSPASTGDLIAAEIAIGYAAGWQCGVCPTELSFSCSDALFRLFGDAAEAFPQGAFCALTNKSDGIERLTVLLRERVKSFVTDPRQIAFVSGLNVRELTERHRAAARLVDVWDEIPFGGVFHIRDASAFDLMRQVDIDTYLDILETFPHPEPVRQIL